MKTVRSTTSPIQITMVSTTTQAHRLVTSIMTALRITLIWIPTTTEYPTALKLQTVQSTVMAMANQITWTSIRTTMALQMHSKPVLPVWMLILTVSTTHLMRTSLVVRTRIMMALTILQQRKTPMLTA